MQSHGWIQSHFAVIYNPPLAPVVFVGRKGNVCVSHVCIFPSTNKKLIVLTDGAAAMSKIPSLDSVLQFFALIGCDCGVTPDSVVKCGGANSTKRCITFQLVHAVCSGVK